MFVVGLQVSSVSSCPSTLTLNVAPRGSDPQLTMLRTVTTKIWGNKAQDEAERKSHTCRTNGVPDHDLDRGAESGLYSRSPATSSFPSLNVSKYHQYDTSIMHKSAARITIETQHHARASAQHHQPHPLTSAAQLIAYKRKKATKQVYTYPASR